MQIELNNEVENSYRKNPVCVGCGNKKGLDTLVCWDCFKHPVHPFKFYDGSITEWLKSINK